MSSHTNQKTPVKRTAGGTKASKEGSTRTNTASTTQSECVEDSYALEANETERAKRRRWLCDQLRDHGKDKRLDQLLTELGVRDNYDQFCTNYQDAFTAVAMHCPAYVDKKLCEPKLNANRVRNKLAKDKGVVKQIYRELSNLERDYIGAANERALVKYFIALRGMISDSRSGIPETEQGLWPEQPYDDDEHQNSQLLGGTHKIDCAVHYNHEQIALTSVHLPVEAKTTHRTNGLTDDDFGQVADYAFAIWNCQPTRVFVPVLFLHGCYMTLLVFTRDKWYKCELGKFCFSTKAPAPKDVSRLRGSLMKLAFLLTLPPQQFGHYCDVNCEHPNYLEFAHSADGSLGGSRGVTVHVVDAPSASVVAAGAPPTNVTMDLDNDCRIDRAIYPRGRMVHLYRVKFCGRDAILKLMWIPTNRLPEPAVYEVLGDAKVDRVPAMYDAGNIVKKSFGYRVDYLVVEDAGVPLLDHLKAYAEDVPEKCDRIVPLIVQVLDCLVRARDIGVLHRDVSPGNIAIRDGKVTLIDWGCAKLLMDDSADDNDDSGGGGNADDDHDDGGDGGNTGDDHDNGGNAGNVKPSTINRLAETWSFNKKDVLRNEAEHDPLTGTVDFMSIPVLAGSQFRSIADDVESALYVLLNTAYELQKDHPLQDKSGIPVAFDYRDSRSLAHVRASCLLHEELYMSMFGVFRYGDNFQKLANSLRQYLLVRDVKYIGSYMAFKQDHQRRPEEEQLGEIIRMWTSVQITDISVRSRATSHAAQPSTATIRPPRPGRWDRTQRPPVFDLEQHSGPDDTASAMPWPIDLDATLQSPAFGIAQQLAADCLATPTRQPRQRMVTQQSPSIAKAHQWAVGESSRSTKRSWHEAEADDVERQTSASTCTTLPTAAPATPPTAADPQDGKKKRRVAAGPKPAGPVRRSERVADMKQQAAPDPKTTSPLRRSVWLAKKKSTGRRSA